MKLSLCLVVCMLFGASVAVAGVGMGTIETGGSLDLHLSPSPWALNADMYLLYYMSNMLGIGPYWSLDKQGKAEGEEEAPPACYSLGAMAKLYPPVAYMNGRLTPFISAGFGIRTVDVYDIEHTEWTTEKKGEFMGKVGFDYWLTENWTVWTAFQADKVFIEDSDMMVSIRIGIATFITK